MKDISYHILDIMQNSIHAGASRMETVVSVDRTNGTLELKIIDNGTGMQEEMLNKVTDPFYTTSEVKRVGLGLPLLKQNAEQTGGTFDIASVENKGTTVTAIFKTGHIDMIPVGDLALTIKMLIASNPCKDIVYRHRCNGEGFDLDTGTIKKNLDGVGINNPEVLEFIVDFINGNLQELNQ
jgi:hypothetical protein